MKRALRLVAIVAIITVVVPLAGFVALGHHDMARVVSRSERVHVLPRSGMRYNTHVITVRREDADSASDTRLATPQPDEQNYLSFAVTSAQYDALRTGSRVDVFSIAFGRQFTWLGDKSLFLSIARMLSARVLAYQFPEPMDVSRVNTAGLARVVAVHRINPRTLPFTRRNNSTRAFEVIEVEFWALRQRNLVRTADVVDARSIQDLGPGQILQMHYDSREPRVLRLDDGTRSIVH